jgi:hypothetical protein
LINEPADMVEKPSARGDISGLMAKNRRIYLCDDKP